MTLKQRWNRFRRDLYHRIHGIKYEPGSLEHLKECKFCRKQFEKWEKQEEVDNARKSNH